MPKALGIAPLRPVLLTLIALVPACNRQVEAPVIRPVRTITVHYGATGEPISLNGLIQAQEQVSLAFQIGGRLIERRVSVGDTVTRHQLIGRIQSQDEMNALRSAAADLAAAQATLVQAQNNENRYRILAETGVASKAQYDAAMQQLAAARSQVAAARASLSTARHNVAYTELRSTVDGVVTAKGAEPGEVVQAGQMIVQVAQSGEKDAVFNVPAALMRPSLRARPVNVALVDDPSVRAIGHVREVSPQADPETRTYQVKVGLDDPPGTMRLGMTVIGSISLDGGPLASVPDTALIQIDGKPAVWVVDRTTMQVSARPVQVLRYDAFSALISGGLADGDLVVTAGAQVLRPGQPVRLLRSETG